MMAELHGADPDLLHRALGVADVDVLAQAERVVHEIEGARDDVPHERLGAEAHRQSDDARARQERTDVDAESGEHGQDAHDADHREDRPARQRQEGPEPRPARPPGFARVADALGPGFALQPLVDRRLRELPHQVREHDGQAYVDQRAAHASPGAAGRHARQIQVPQADDDQNAGGGDHDVDAPLQHRQKARAGPRHSVRLDSPRPPGQQPAERHVDERHGEHDQEAQDPRPAGAETAGQLLDRQDHQEAQDVGRHQGRPEVGQQPAEGALPVASDLGRDRGTDAPHQTEVDQRQIRAGRPWSPRGTAHAARRSAGGRRRGRSRRP